MNINLLDTNPIKPVIYKQIVDNIPLGETNSDGYSALFAYSVLFAKRKLQSLYVSFKPYIKLST